MREWLGLKHITPQQRAVIESVRDHRRTAAPSGNGLGKTHVAARLVLWFLYAHPGSKVVTTAPTWNQVANLLWREIRTAHQQARVELGGHVNQTSINLSTDWFAVGLSTDDPTRFQGVHAPRVMVVFDEATGVAPGIWEAAEGLAVGPDDRFLALGNPTDPASRFKTAEDSGIWNVVRLNGEEHPNVLEGRAVIPGAVTREWVEEKLIEYGGRESPLYRARVRGLWPEGGDDALIPLALVEAAQARWSRPAPSAAVAAVGCDVARFGSDETVIVKIHDGGAVGVPEARVGQDLMATAGMLKRLHGDGVAPRVIGVDDAGLGGGVTDRLRELGCRVTPVNAGEGANDSLTFVNRRAEIWWALREALKAGEISLPPQDSRLAADLTNVRYSYDSRGRVRLEAKDDIKKRIGRSPDRGDALAIANWVRLPRLPQWKSSVFRR